MRSRTSVTVKQPPSRRRITGRVSHRLLYPLIAFLGLAGVFVLYEYVHVPRQQAELSREVFRTLAITGDQVQQRIEGLALVLQALKRQEEQERPRAKGKVRDRKRNQFLRNTGVLAYQGCPGEQKKPPQATRAPATRSSPGRSLSMRFAYAGGGYVLQLEYRDGPFQACARADFQEIVRPLLAEIPPGLFDELLISTSGGQVIFQTREGEHRVTNLLRWLEQGQAMAAAPQEKSSAAKEAAPADALRARVEMPSGSSTRDVFLGDSRYTAFLQPILMQLGEGETASTQSTFLALLRTAIPGTEARLLLCGLMNSQAVRTSSRVIPRYLITWTVFGLLGFALLSYPMTKVRMLNPAERLRRTEGFFMGLSIAGGIFIATLLILYGWRSMTLDLTDHYLAKISGSIDEHLRDELTGGMEFLDSLLFTEELASDRRQADAQAPDTSCADDLGLAQTVRMIPRAKIRHLQVIVQKGRKPTTTPLPWDPEFELAFWADARGNQRIKWTSRDLPSPATCIARFEFFQGLVEGEPWHLRSRNGSVREFRLESVYSPNTAEHVPVLAQLHPRPERRSNWVAGTAISLKSIVHSILPPGYGMAVIGPSGLVLFHPNPSRIRRENLFRGTDRPAALRAAVFSRSPGYVTARYLGTLHRFYITPFQSITGWPLMLVVFRDLRTDVAMHVEVILLFAILGLLSAVFHAVMWWLICRDGKISLEDLQLVFWPHPENDSAYQSIKMSQWLAFILFLQWILVGGAHSLLAASLVWPLLCTIQIYLRTGWNFDVFARMRFVSLGMFLALLAVVVLTEEGWQRGFLLVNLLMLALLFAWEDNAARQRTPKRRDLTAAPPAGSAQLVALWRRYVAAAAPMFFVVGMLPAVAYYRIAFEYQQILFARSGQVLLLEALGKRDERIEDRYLHRLGRVVHNRRQNPQLNARREDQTDRYDLVLAPPPELATPTAAINPVLNFLAQLTYWFPNPEAAAARQLTLNQSPASDYDWLLIGPNSLQIRRKSEPGQAWEPIATWWLPALFDPTPGPWQMLTFRTLVVIILTGLSLVLLLLLVRFLVRRTVEEVFRGQAAAPPWPPLSNGWFEKLLDAPAGRRILVVEASGYSILQGLRTDDPRLEVISIPGQPAGDSPWKAGSPEKPLVVLDAFEYADDDERWTRSKVGLLETLLFQKPRAIILLAKEHPETRSLDRIAELQGSSAPNREHLVALHRRFLWILGQFEVFRYGDWPQAGAGPETEAACRELWDFFTPGEKLVLYQVAQDGWVNPQNADAIRYLCRRGLISLAPMWRVDHPGLSAFLEKASVAEEVHQHQTRVGTSDWQLARSLFVVAAMLLLAMVLSTQEQSVTTLVGWLGALAGSIPAVIRLLSLGRGQANHGGAEAA